MDNENLIDESGRRLTFSGRLLMLIPNLFTLLNLFFGTLAIIFVLQTGETLIQLQDGDAIITFPEKIWWGSICIGIAAVVDFLDGFVARLFKATSELGKQLDSLADVVSFGVAPGIILYQLLRISFAKEENGLDVSIIWIIPALIIPCAAAYRLAKFNLDTRQTFHFIGVPTPAVGLLIASFPLIIFYNDFNVNQFILNKWVLYTIIVVLSYLMVSELPMMSLKFKDYTLKNNFSKILLLVLGIIAAIFFHWLAVPIIFVLYFIFSILNKPTVS